MLIHLEKISKVYQMGEVEIPALLDIDLEIHRREFIAIMGPSGSGR